jgi:hypothetical protein
MFGAAAPAAFNAALTPAPRLKISQNRKAVRVANIRSSFNITL